DESDGEHCERFALDADVGTSLLAGDAMPGC
ncbi:N-acetyltransferase, partial [Mesorhizobium sp. M00.F.Ca.ET.158.01.1.1]